MSIQDDLQLVSAEQAGFSSERLKRVDDVVREHIENGDLPGAITMIIRRGQLVHYAAQGYMDIESKRPMVKDTICRMYSMTKPLTATAIMLLYEEGKLLLDDPVSKFIPAFAHQTVIVPGWPEGKARYSPRGRVFTAPVNRDVTIRDLLTHTAGLASPRLTPIVFIKELIGAIGGSLFLPLEEGKARPMRSTRETVDNLARIPLSFQPGTDWQYGHEYDVLGVIVEIISGQTLEDFFQRTILGPLGMIDTSFILTEDKLKRLCTEYTWDDSWNLRVYEKPENAIKLGAARNMYCGLGDFGGVLSTIADYSRFVRMLIQGGSYNGVQLLAPKTVDLMSSDHTRDLFVNARGYGWGYGFSLGVLNDNTHAICTSSAGLYSWGGASCTYFFIDPAEELIGMAFSQVLGYGYKPGFRFSQKFDRAIYQALIDTN